MALHPDFLTRPLAHRGLHDRKQRRAENAPLSFRHAIENGYGIELDLQLSADNQAMVFHDDLLDRLTDETGPVRDRTAAELGRMKLKDSDDTIPTLAQVLDLVDGKAPLLIEIKDQDGQLGPNVGALEQATVDILKHYQGPVAVMSFNPHAVIAVRALSPVLELGLVTCDFLSDPEWRSVDPARLRHLTEIGDFDALGACFISHDRNDLGRPRVAELKAMGAAILCWTVRSETQEAEARKVADNITFEGYLA